MYNGRECEQIVVVMYNGRECEQIVVVMHNQDWSVSRTVLTGMDGKVLHLDTVCSWFYLLCLCVRVCVCE